MFFPEEIGDARRGGRKLLCLCGKPLGTFTARGLELYCRFSKETTTVPYNINNLEAGVAFAERRWRQRRRPDQGRRR